MSLSEHHISGTAYAVYVAIIDCVHIRFMVYLLQKSCGTMLLQLKQVHDFLNTYNYIIIAALCLRYYIKLYIIIMHSEYSHMHGTVQAQMSTCTITKDTMSTSRPFKSLKTD